MASRNAAARRQEEKDQGRPTQRGLTLVGDGPRYADVGEVEVFAEGLSNQFLHCRELGHLWRPYSGGRYEENGGFSRILKCHRCKTKREQEIDNRGLILSNKYIYPEGYQVEGLGRIVGEGRGVLRLQSMIRLTKED
jgi:hypothetical protein